MERAEHKRAHLSPNEAKEPTLVLLVRAGASLCAIPILAVVETMRALPVRPAKGAAPFVRGLAIIRGEPTPVVDLGALLGGSDAAPGVRFVTLRSGDRHVAIDVDAVVGVRAIDVDAFAATPKLLGGAVPEQVERLGTLDGQMLAVLDTARLFSEELSASLASGDGA
jgi:purine-binding chemotaxis protein CheW